MNLRLSLALFSALISGCYITFDPVEPMTCEWVEESHCYEACWDRPVCEQRCNRFDSCTETCWVEEICGTECGPSYREYCY
jgi:hypothetical protein